jgi:cytochrome oxidase Cu insertion factor (SCO1/SenC/PrrC family)
VDRLLRSRCGDACLMALVHAQRLTATWPRAWRRQRHAPGDRELTRSTHARAHGRAAPTAPRGRWLTAPDTAALAPVLADFGQRVERDDAERLSHVLKVFLVDGRGDVRNVYSTGLLDPRLVAADVETLLAAR